MQIKGGQQTDDVRLDRVIHFDEKSRAFPVREVIAPTKPRSYSWKAGPVVDQGKEGACVGFGWTGSVLARPQACPPPADANAYALGVYREAQKIDAYPGEDYSGTDVLAGAKVLQSRGIVVEYRWAFGLDDVVLALGYKGTVVLGINWYESMYEAPNGRVNVSGQKVGGHCILARGVNVKNQTVLLRNSWGVDWGSGGDAVISFDDLGKLLADAGEACVPIHRRVTLT